MKILLVKTSSLGDVIQTLPVVSFLNRVYPNAEIDFVVEKSFQDILKAHSGIHQVIPVEIRKWRKRLFHFRKELKAAIAFLRGQTYDLVFDLQGNIKSGCITKCVRANEKVGTTFRSAPEWPNAFALTHRYFLNKADPITSQYLSLVQKHLKSEISQVEMVQNLTISSEEKKWIESTLQEKKRIMVCPGSNWENKKLSLPTWIELLKTAANGQETFFYFVWGSEKEEQEALSLHSQFRKTSMVLPKMSLPLWQNFMKEMDLIFTVDSSALHLAATTNVSTRSIFGPSSAAVYKPHLKNHVSFQGKCPYGKMFTKRCPSLRSCKTGACLKNLDESALKETLINHQN
ncbi:MAG: lipopolysaccharide heptosyltransferase I [Simkaniaceae bacterium]|nr:lipopolysaccharide heptosyltransferase I [Simkaniaceae bacterium]